MDPGMTKFSVAGGQLLAALLKIGALIAFLPGMVCAVVHASLKEGSKPGCQSHSFFGYVGTKIIKAPGEDSV